MDYYEALARQSGNSRHDRRRRAKLADFRAGSLMLVGPDYLAERAAADPRFRFWLSGWIDRIAAFKPICLHCEKVFTFDEPPTLWGLIRPDLREPDETLCGICGDCISCDPIGDAVRALRRAGLTVRPVNYANLAAGGRA